MTEPSPRKTHTPSESALSWRSSVGRRMSEVFAATIDSAVKQRPASCQGLKRKGGARGRGGPRTESLRAWQKPLPRWKAMTTAASRNSHSGVSIEEGRPEPAGMSVAQHQKCATKNHNQLARVDPAAHLFFRIACLGDAEHLTVLQWQPHGFHLAIAEDVPG